VNNLSIFKPVGNSNLLTLTDNNFAFCEKTKKDLEPAFSFGICWYFEDLENKPRLNTNTEAEFYALLEEITEVEFLQQFIYFAYKIDKNLIIARALHFSVIIQVQER